MKRSNRLILLIGVFLAIVAFVGIVIIFQRPAGGTPGTGASELPTVFATRDIPLGTEIKADMLRSANIKVTERDTSAFNSPSALLGKIARADIPKDKMLTQSDFSLGAPTEIRVSPGQRAMTVQVDQVSGVGTLIRAGDYVDVLVGFSGEKFPVITLNQDDSFTVVSGINATSVKLLLQGIQVIGHILPPRETTQNQNQTEDPGTTLTGQQEIVVLSVNQQQAEVIKFAQLDGSLSLVLRSPSDFRDEGGNPIIPPPNQTTGMTLRLLVDEYKVLIPQLVETLLPRQ